MATAAEIADYDTEELERQLDDTRRELFNLRFQLATGQLDNFSRINHVRKDVARMLTELRNREIAEAEGMAFEELPAHVAAARRRSEDEALGRSRTTASERRAAARAAEEGLTGEDDEGVVDDEELAEEVADDDGMAPADGDGDDAFDEGDEAGDEVGEVDAEVADEADEADEADPEEKS
jgi:large subunit ribosomal protein L29